MPKPRADQDSAWKDILRQYFQEAMTFFFAQTAALIDWSRPHEFLDKELGQIALDAETGKRYADQLVKVWLRDGAELWLLLHLEIQAQREVEFPQRMFTYNLRIFDRFQRPAISLAILCDANTRWRPGEFSFAYPDTSLSFRFGVVKLLDYRDRWPQLEASDNPFALVVLAHLQNQATRRDAPRRKEVKLSLVRRLYERGYGRQEVVNLFRFVDWVMILPEGLKQEFWQQLKAYEEERRMPYITSVEEIGFERGVQQGLQQGLEQGKRSLVLRQLIRKVGDLPPSLQTQMEALCLPQLEALGEALLDFTGLEDLQHWLAQHGQ